MSKRAILCTVLFTLVCSSGAMASLAGSPCNETQTNHILTRPATAPNGREFMQQVSGMSDDARESAILGQLLQGNIPAFLRHLRPVVLSARLPDGQVSKAIVCVAPDYLAIAVDL